VLRFYYQRYHLPLLITENGISLDDRVSEDGSVHDEKRIGYIREYLDGVSRAVQEGIPVLGYQYWSLTDNFEWAEGYAPRFGLIYVDYETKKRIIKDSGYAYAEIIRKM
jgi:beta-glucosidase